MFGLWLFGRFSPPLRHLHDVRAVCRARQAVSAVEHSFHLAAAFVRVRRFTYNMDQSHFSRVDVIFASGLASLDAAAVDTVVMAVAVVAVVVAFVCCDSGCCFF